MSEHVLPKDAWHCGNLECEAYNPRPPSSGTEALQHPWLKRPWHVQQRRFEPFSREPNPSSDSFAGLKFVRLEPLKDSESY